MNVRKITLRDWLVAKSQTRGGEFLAGGEAMLRKCVDELVRAGAKDAAKWLETRWGDR